jgi:hypothetical protein
MSIILGRLEMLYALDLGDDLSMGWVTDDNLS